ncbi:hypothetical protein [Sphaerisporangium corydalis]|uniref:DUF4352 domain-containing protein n=1 Tax=Sphaerisporangium corydalis TaxID=1441875 RepID=A0ABV9E989_9ACTN|nr:hypothetical protein [Sphaerisporangium corydalis]
MPTVAGGRPPVTPPPGRGHARHGRWVVPAVVTLVLACGAGFVVFWTGGSTAGGSRAVAPVLVTGIGGRIPLGTGFDSPWTMVQTAGCGYPSHTERGVDPTRQTCRVFVVLGNPSPEPVRMADHFPDLVDDRGGTHPAVREPPGRAPVVQPGQRLTSVVFTYEMARERRPVRLEGRLIQAGPIVRVPL